MDHHSSHAHQSHPLSPTAPNPARQPTYTTVGSVYNPQVGTHLQPPVRRGRPIRFPPQSDLASAPKPAVPGLPLKGLQSPPRAQPVVLCYSPLQQNLQRAVGPMGTRDHGTAPKPIMATLQPKSRVVKPALPMPAVPKETGSSSGSTPGELSSFAIENGADHPDVDILTSFNARSLNNLSSFPHRFQRHAQAALARGRNPLAATTNFQAVPTTLGSTSAPTATLGFSGRVATPPGFTSRASTPPGFPSRITTPPGLPSRVTMPPGLPSRITTPPGLPSRKTDLDPTFWHAVVEDPSILRGADFSSQAKARAEIMRQSGRMVPPYPLVDTHKAVQPPPNPRPQRYTTLSSGPGAPAPLQAGPPGQRHYKPSTLEGTFKALQDSVQRAVPNYEAEQAKTADMDGASTQLKHPSRPSTWLGSPTSAQSTASTRGKAIATLPPIAPPKVDGTARVASSELSEYEEWLRQRRDRIVDTLSPGQAMKYYPRGFPSNYNPGTVVPVSPNWTDKYPLHGKLKPPMTHGEKEVHDAKLAVAFYAGTAGLGRTMDDSIRDAERRAYGGQYGAIGQERALSRQRRQASAAGLPKQTKTEYRHLSVEQVNSEETADSAAPLLNMTFEMLLSYMENEGKKGRQSGFQDPEPWMIDFTEDGTRSFFDNVKQEIHHVKARRA